MRFPEIPFMDRVFGLFTYLGLEKDITPDPPLQTLIPYIMSAQDAEGNDLNIMFFNNKILTGAQFKAQEVAPLYDPFNTGVDLGNTYGTLINNKIGEFKERLAQGFTPENWDFLMQMDEYSTRSYMALTEPKYDDSVRLLSFRTCACSKMSPRSFHIAKLLTPRLDYMIVPFQRV